MITQTQGSNTIVAMWQIFSCRRSIPGLPNISKLNTIDWSAMPLYMGDCMDNTFNVVNLVLTSELNENFYEQTWPTRVSLMDITRDCLAASIGIPESASARWNLEVLIECLFDILVNHIISGSSLRALIVLPACFYLKIKIQWYMLCLMP